MYWDRYFYRLKEGIKENVLSLENFSKYKSEINKQIINHLDLKEKNNENERETIQKYVNESKNLFSDLFVKQKRDDSLIPIKELKEKISIEYYNFDNNDESLINKTPIILNQLTYYNLVYVFKKFDGRISLLRRDYSSGQPIEEFLRCSKIWFVDPFGGFFINSVDERKDYMHLNNIMLKIIWDLGIKLKINQFKNIEK